jgi:type IV secretory pathway protease TraF
MNSQAEPAEVPLREGIVARFRVRGRVVALNVFCTGEGSTHYIWNVSESVPIGFYRLQPTVRLFVTELVAVQPPEPFATFLADGRYLPRGIPMLKRVLALPGQTVCRDRLTITVDKIEIGEAHERDCRGRPLPIWQGCPAENGLGVHLSSVLSATSLA